MPHHPRSLGDNGPAVTYQQEAELKRTVTIFRYLRDKVDASRSWFDVLSIPFKDLATGGSFPVHELYLNVSLIGGSSPLFHLFHTGRLALLEGRILGYARTDEEMASDPEVMQMEEALRGYVVEFERTGGREVWRERFERVRVWSEGTEVIFKPSTPMYKRLEVIELELSDAPLTERMVLRDYYRLPGDPDYRPRLYSPLVTPVFAGAATRPDGYQTREREMSPTPAGGQGQEQGQGQDLTGNNSGGTIGAAEGMGMISAAGSQSSGTEASTTAPTRTSPVSGGSGGQAVEQEVGVGVQQRIGFPGSNGSAGAMPATATAPATTSTKGTAHQVGRAHQEDMREGTGGQGLGQNGQQIDGNTGGRAGGVAVGPASAKATVPGEDAAAHAAVPATTLPNSSNTSKSTSTSIPIPPDSTPSEKNIPRSNFTTSTSNLFGSSGAGGAGNLFGGNAGGGGGVAPVAGGHQGGGFMFAGGSGGGSLFGGAGAGTGAGSVHSIAGAWGSGAIFGGNSIHNTTGRAPTLTAPSGSHLPLSGNVTPGAPSTRVQGENQENLPPIQSQAQVQGATLVQGQIQALPQTQAQVQNKTVAPLGDGSGLPQVERPQAGLAIGRAQTEDQAVPIGAGGAGPAQNADTLGQERLIEDMQAAEQDGVAPGAPANPGNGIVPAGEAQDNGDAMQVDDEEAQPEGPFISLTAQKKAWAEKEIGDLSSLLKQLVLEENPTIVINGVATQIPRDEALMRVTVSFTNITNLRRDWSAPNVHQAEMQSKRDVDATSRAQEATAALSLYNNTPIKYNYLSPTYGNSILKHREKHMMIMRSNGMRCLLSPGHVLNVDAQSRRFWMTPENIGPAFDKEYDLGTSAPYNLNGLVMPQRAQDPPVPVHRTRASTTEENPISVVYDTVPIFLPQLPTVTKTLGKRLGEAVGPGAKAMKK